MQFGVLLSLDQRDASILRASLYAIGMHLTRQTATGAVPSTCFTASTIFASSGRRYASIGSL
jgi:hypothetical protein